VSEVAAPYGAGESSGAGSFDARTATEAEILARACPLVGLSLGEVSTRPAERVVSARETRGSVGAIVERYFGIQANSEAAPDFTGAAIELKTIPLVKRARGWTVKERTFVTHIDYGRLATEEWPTASIRPKLDSILFVFYEWQADTDIYAFRVVDTLLWHPASDVMPVLQGDWTVVREKVREGRAGDVSESDGRMLAAATKAADGAARTTQPFSSERVRPRAWALKPSLTRALYEELVLGQPTVEVAPLIGATETTFEAVALRLIAGYVGRSLGDVRRELDIPDSGGKSEVAFLVRRMLGLTDPRIRIAEFRRTGTEPKLVWCHVDAVPYECMSFPAFRYRELVAETWEDSDLRGQLSRLLVVPVTSPARETPVRDRVLGQPFFWSPTDGELEAIGHEWEMYRAAIAAGSAAHLPTAAATSYIHVRPHGQNSRDTDDAPVVGPVVKKSFWLNKPYMRQILLANGAVPG
jgi:DNA mismatch repair protein MutH